MPTDFNVGGFSANVNAKILRFSDGTNQTTAYSEPAGSKQLFVDANRADTFVADGSFDRPFSTIMGAVNLVIANGDNGTFGYTVFISPGTYLETVDLSNGLLTNLSFVGAGQEVIIGSNAFNFPVLQAINNDNLISVLFNNIIFALNGTTTHGIHFTSATPGTSLGLHGIIFRACGIQDNISDVNFNNVGFVEFDDTGITANINIKNVNEVAFINNNGPNPQTPFVIVTDTGSPTPINWAGSSNAIFQGCQVGSVTCDAASTVDIENCSVSGDITTASTTALVVLNSALTGNVAVQTNGVMGLVNSLVGQPNSGPSTSVSVSGIMLSTVSNISNTNIVVENGGYFIEEGSLHDDGTITVNSGGAYTTQADMGVGTIFLSGHLNNITGNPDVAGTLTITSGTAASFTFEAAFVSAPSVVITPQSDPTSIGSYWVTSTNTGFTITMKNSGTMTFNYHVIGNPN